jgi:hypothetical protein
MKNILIFCLGLTMVCVGNAQNKDEVAIKLMLTKQTQAWNVGDISSFMIGYWQNDSLLFIGKNGPKYGHQTTLNNYKKGYPDTTAMGKLTSTVISLKKLSHEYYFVVGKWHLTRTIGNIEGHYTLLLQKIKGRWVIVADHSS